VSVNTVGVTHQISDYRNLGEIGRGDNGIVYRAQNVVTSGIVAVKAYRLGGHWIKERVRQEAYQGAILSHPNIVTVYGFAEQAYVLMECLDGQTLKKALAEPEPVGVVDALSILRQTGSALDYMHHQGIIHRDMKPSNILIHQRTQAKVIDLGSVQSMSQRTTPWLGALSYAAPEHLQGCAADGRADQWSLAVIAYELLTGAKPFRLLGEPPYLKALIPVLVFSIVNDEPVSPQRLNPALSPRVDSVLRKALAKDRNDRYRTCGDFVEDLASALATNGRVEQNDAAPPKAS